MDNIIIRLYTKYNSSIQIFNSNDQVAFILHCKFFSFFNFILLINNKNWKKSLHRVEFISYMKNIIKFKLWKKSNENLSYSSRRLWLFKMNLCSDEQAVFLTLFSRMPRAKMRKKSRAFFSFLSFEEVKIRKWTVSGQQI